MKSNFKCMCIFSPQLAVVAEELRQRVRAVTEERHEAIRQLSEIRTKVQNLQIKVKEK